MIDNRERLRRLGTLLAFVILSNVLALGITAGVAQKAPPVYAESASFDPGPPKGVVGQDGIACTGTASQDGNTLKYTVYIGADGDEMASNPSREREWQRSYCRWALEQDMGGWFKYQWGQDLKPESIQVSIRGL